MRLAPNTNLCASRLITSLLEGYRLSVSIKWGKIRAVNLRGRGDIINFTCFSAESITRGRDRSGNSTRERSYTYSAGFLCATSPGFTLLCMSAVSSAGGLSEET